MGTSSCTANASNYAHQAVLLKVELERALRQPVVLSRHHQYRQRLQGHHSIAPNSQVPRATAGSVPNRRPTRTEGRRLDLLRVHWVLLGIRENDVSGSCSCATPTEKRRFNWRNCLWHIHFYLHVVNSIVLKELQPLLRVGVDNFPSMLMYPYFVPILGEP